MVELPGSVGVLPLGWFSMAWGAASCLLGLGLAVAGATLAALPVLHILCALLVPPPMCTSVVSVCAGEKRRLSKKGWFRAAEIS